MPISRDTDLGSVSSQLSRRDIVRILGLSLASSALPPLVSPSPASAETDTSKCDCDHVEEPLSASMQFSKIDKPGEITRSAAVISIASRGEGLQRVGFYEGFEGVNAVDRILNSVPALKQDTSSSCARASAAMVLNHWGYQWGVGDRRLKNEIAENACIEDDVCPRGLANSFRKATGYKIVGERIRTNQSKWFDTIKAYINSREPVITLIPNGQNLDWNFSRGHYIVVRGYRDDGKVYFADPWDGGYWEAGYNYFAKAWGTGSPDAFGWQGVVTHRLLQAKSNLRNVFSRNPLITSQS